MAVTLLLNMSIRSLQIVFPPEGRGGSERREWAIDGDEVVLADPSGGADGMGDRFCFQMTRNVEYDDGAGGTAWHDVTYCHEIAFMTLELSSNQMVKMDRRALNAFASCGMLDGGVFSSVIPAPAVDEGAGSVGMNRGQTKKADKPDKGKK
jgi:hypothetical protein